MMQMASRYRCILIRNIYKSTFYNWCKIRWWDFNKFACLKESCHSSLRKGKWFEEPFSSGRAPIESRWQCCLSVDGTPLLYSEAIIDIFKGLLKYIFLLKIVYQRFLAKSNNSSVYRTKIMLNITTKEILTDCTFEYAE